MLCISTNFWVLRAPKSWSKPFFFAVFQPFLFTSKLFPVLTSFWVRAAPKSWLKYTTLFAVLHLVSIKRKRTKSIKSETLNYKAIKFNVNKEHIFWEVTSLLSMKKERQYDTMIKLKVMSRKGMHSTYGLLCFNTMTLRYSITA